MNIVDQIRGLVMGPGIPVTGSTTVGTFDLNRIPQLQPIPWPPSSIDNDLVKSIAAIADTLKRQLGSTDETFDGDVQRIIDDNRDVLMQTFNVWAQRNMEMVFRNDTNGSSPDGELELLRFRLRVASECARISGIREVLFPKAPSPSETK